MCPLSCAEINTQIPFISLGTSGVLTVIEPAVGFVDDHEPCSPMMLHYWKYLADVEPESLQRSRGRGH